jgi:hypothetical protein
MATFLATIPLPRVDHHLVGGDGIRYFAITRSLLLDHDFDYANDYRLLGEIAQPAVTGHPANPQAMGTSLLWVPFFLMAHAISLVLHLTWQGVKTNGVSYLYEAAACLGTIVYAGLGFLLVARSLAREGLVEPKATAFALAGLWWATPVIYYVVADPRCRTESRCSRWDYG